jgi:hypothetical protein
VQPAARQIEGVARRQHDVQCRRSLCGCAHLVGVTTPSLPFQRVRQHRRMDAPAFGAVDLQHEHVVGVVVGGETLTAGRRQVRVHLQWLTQLGAEAAGEVHNGRPDPVQSLQHQRGSIGVQMHDFVVDDLVADLGAGAAAAGVAGRRQHRALLGHPQERRAQTAPAEQLVDGVR